MATNALALPTELNEELETIRSILTQDTRVVNSQDGTIMVTLDLPRGEMETEKLHEITFILSRTYPSSSPTVLIDSCSLPSDLEEQLDLLSESLLGVPALFSLYQAAAEWVESKSGEDLENIHTSTLVPENVKIEEFEVQSGDAIKPGNVDPSLFEGMVRSLEEEKKQQKEPPETVPAKKGKGKSKSDRKKDASNEQAAKKQTEESSGGKKEAMKSATDVIHRIIWDPELQSEHFTIGYLDRFVGIIEKPFTEFSWEDLATADLDVLAIPKHRIQYFKYKTEVIWDKNKMMDKVYGTRGANVTIQEVIEEYDAKHPQSKPSEVVTKEVVAEPEPQEKPTTTDLDTDALVELIMEDSDEELDDDVMGDVASFNTTRAVSRKYKNKDRPNYFLCFKVTDGQIREQVKVLQEGIVSSCPVLSDGCLPPNRLHVTLVMLRIDTEEEMYKAIEVIGNFQRQLVRILPQFNKIEISGVDCFRDQVIFAQVKANSALTRVASALKIQLEEAGIGTPGNHVPFKPHMTLIKLSRPLAKKMNITRIPYGIYQAFREFYFGAQSVEQLMLGSMFELSEEDGFYVHKFSVSNQISCLRADMTEIVLAQVLKNICAANRSLPCVKQIEEILRKDIDKSTLIDQILSIVMHSETPVHQDHDVIIMRGLPGSGKSTLIESSTEKHQEMLVVCSADNFFTDNLTGEYRFDIEKLSGAHEACFNSFLENLIAGKPLIVVDNTNSQLWEYAVYKCFAKCFGYQCSVLELFCPDEDRLKQYHHRNKHNLNYDVIVAMRNRWENDRESVVVDSKRLPTHSLLSLVKKKESSAKSKQETTQSKISSVILLAVFLSQNSTNELIKQFPPKFDNLNASHVTLQFIPSFEQISKYKLGASVSLNVLGCVSDDRVQAAPIHFDSDIKSDNAHPHVTISVSNIGHAKDSNNLLNRIAKKENLNNLPNRPDNLVLSGTVGVQVELKDGHSQRVFSIAELEALRKPKPPKHPKSSLSIDIYTGPSDLITQLFLFDFDGTLVNTPGPVEGPGLYEKGTGSAWPHKKWTVYGESLVHPMSTHCSPGPALFQFFSHQSRSQSVTVVMTGRLESISASVREVLSNFSVHPDILLCKEDNSPLRTPEYKALQLRKLLEQYPKVQYVKIWDDLAENLACFANVTVDYLDKEFELVDVLSFQQQPHSAKKKPASSSPTKKSKVFQTVRLYGKVQRTSYHDAVENTIGLISSLWASCINYEGSPDVLIHPFGSYPLKRMSDIDLCLLAPEKLTQVDCIARIEKLLTQCGIECIHTSPYSRVPRVSFMCSYTGSPDIQFDVIFMRMKEMPEAVPAKLKEWKKLISTDDSSSVTALEGLEFLNRVRQNLIKGMSEEDLAALIELVVLILRSKHQKGNAFHCIRTFHVIKLLLGLVEGKQIARSCLSSADQLLKQFLEQLTALSSEEWTGYLGEFVPTQYIPRIQEIFTECASIASSPSFPSVAVYHKMLSPVAFPLPNHVAMDIEIECPSRCLQFRYETMIEAKFGSAVRKILDSGVKLSPGPCSRKRICFCIPDIPEQKDRCHAMMKEFFAEFEKLEHEVKISFNGQSAIEFGSLLHQAELEGIFSQILAFKSSEETSLSLPTNLQSHQRLLVYQLLEKHGLSHVTSLEGSAKRIVVKKS